MWLLRVGQYLAGRVISLGCLFSDPVLPILQMVGGFSGGSFVNECRSRLPPVLPLGSLII